MTIRIPSRGRALLVLFGVLLAGCTLPVGFGGFGGFGNGANGANATPAPGSVVDGTVGKGGGSGVAAGNVSLLGTIRLDDDSGVQGVEVLVVREGRATRSTPNAKGEYRFEGIAPGAYQLIASASRYIDYTKPIDIQKKDQPEDPIVLTSPLQAISLTPRDSFIYGPPTDPSLVPDKTPTNTSIDAVLIKQSGRSVPGNAVGLLEWSSSDTVLASIATGIDCPNAHPANDPSRPAAVSVCAGSKTGTATVIIEARVMADKAIMATTSIEVRDPGALVRFEVLNLGGPR